MKSYAIGIDLGGTKIEVAIVDSNGQIVDSVRTPTGNGQDADAIISKIADLVKQLFQKNIAQKITAVGIGIAGQVDSASGTVKYAPNLEWHNVALCEELSEKISLPVIVSNDVKAAMYGEWKFGAGKSCNDLVCVFVGTGIGGGIVSNGEIMHGYHNTAGEVGHMTIDLHGPVCHCGNKGCFEALAGGWAIERDTREAVQDNKESGKLLLELANGDIEKISGETIAAAIKQDDTLAINIMNKVTEALIAGATSIVNAIGPQKLILGGGIIEGMPQLIKHIEEGVKKYALKAATESLEIVPAALHNNSGVIGAAMMSLAHFEKINQ